MPHRLSTPSSTTSSAALSLHHCSACSEVSDSILSPYDAFNGPSDSSSDTGTSEKRFYALQTLLSIGEADPVQVAAALSSLDPDESLISLATHIVKIHFPRSGYLGNASTSLIREISQAWDAGYDEIRVAQRLRDGKVAPPSTGGCWPARVAASDEGNATVFIGGLTGDVTEYYLAAVFAVFGPYTGVKVLPPKSGTSYCGFVHYVHRSDAEVVVKVMQGFEMMGHRLRISWGRSTGHQTSEVYRGSSMRLESGGGDTNANRVSTFGQGYSESSAPATVDPNLIVQVAKQIDSKVAMEYLRLVDEKFKGDGAAFIDILRTVVAIKGVTHSLSPPPIPSQHLSAPSTSSSFSHTPFDVPNIWHTSQSSLSASSSTWHRNSDPSSLDSLSDGSFSQVVTPPLGPSVPDRGYSIGPLDNVSGEKYGWNSKTPWDRAAPVGPLDWPSRDKSQYQGYSGLGLSLKSSNCT